MKPEAPSTAGGLPGTQVAKALEHVNYQDGATAESLKRPPAAFATAQTAQAHCDSLDGPSIPETDKALAAGDVEPVLKLLTDTTEHGVREHLQKPLTQKKFDKNNVQAGREFVKAYVEYTHYVKGMYDATAPATHGHFPETATPADAHPHRK